MLWEHRAEDDAAAARWSGLTDNYLRVDAVVPAAIDLRNTITPTRLTGLTNDHLAGAPLYAL